MSHTPIHVLILSPTGKIGQSLVPQALSKGLVVRLLVRDVEKASKQFGAQSSTLQYAKGDYANAQDIEKALHGIDRLFLNTQEANPKTETAIAEAAKKAGVKLIVKLSVLNASTHDGSFSILTDHGQSESAVANVGVPFVFLRPTFFIQNLLGDAAGIKGQGVFYRPAVTLNPIFKQSFIDTRDISEAVATILSATTDLPRFTGRTFQLTAEAHNFDEQAALITKATGKEVKAVQVDDASWWEALQKHGLPEYYAFLLLKLYQGYRSSAPNVFGDYKIITGKNPRTLADFFHENKHLFG
jgi:uncharacterized protein YbjT (DUF2867 family)